MQRVDKSRRIAHLRIDTQAMVTLWFTRDAEQIVGRERRERERQDEG